MPTIPHYQNKGVEIPTKSGAYIPDSFIESAQGLGRALQSLGGKIKEYEEIDRKKTEAQDLLDAQGIVNSVRLGAESDIDVLRRSGMKSADFSRDANSVLKKHLNAANERLNGLRTGQGQNYALKLLGDWHANSIVKIGDEADKKFVSEGRADAMFRLTDMEKIASTAPDYEAQARADEIVMFLDGLKGSLYSDEEVAKMKLESVQRVAETRMRGYVMEDPVNALNSLADPRNTKSLTAPQIERLTKFAEVRMTAMRAEQDRNDARAKRQLERKQEVLEAALTRDILRGRDISADLTGDTARELDGKTLRTLAEFQKSFRSGGLEVSDSAQLLRWHLAARSGRDPQTGNPITSQDILNAAGLANKDRGVLVDRFFDKRDARQQKAETLRDKHTKRGEEQIKLLLGSDSGLLGAILGGGRRNLMSDLNLYEAMVEYDALVERHPDRDPRDIADEVGMKHARALVVKATTDDAKLFAGLGINSLDDLMEKVRTGQMPRQQADSLLRLGEFLKYRQQQGKPDEVVETEEQKQRSNFAALREWLNRALFGAGGDRSAPRPLPSTR